MKAIFNSILSFEVFFEIAKLVDCVINPQRSGNMGLNRTDMHYYFGSCSDDSVWDVHYGYFQASINREQMKLLKQEMLVLEPLGKAENEDNSDYFVVVVGVVGWSHQKFGVVVEELGHLYAGKGYVDTDLDVNKMTNVIVLLPMNQSMSPNQTKILQTHYSILNDRVVYSKNGKVYLPYSTSERVVDDIRD